MDITKPEIVIPIHTEVPEKIKELTDKAVVLKDNEITSVLIGASKPSQILDNCGMINNICFSEEELKKIDEIVL